MEMHYHWEQTAAKKWDMAALKGTHQAKEQCNFDSGQLEQQKGGLHTQLLMNLVNLRDFLGVATKLKESIANCSRTTKSNPLLHPEHYMGFVNRMDQSMINYRIAWYPDEGQWCFPFV